MANEFPKCAPEVCAALPASLAVQCKDSGFPPDHPVAVVRGETDICQCTCGDAAGPERIAFETGEAIAIGVPDCPWMECEFAPVTVEACQGLPPGTPLVLHSGTTEKCRCSCWGGELAPYKVLDGEGAFVALDQLPAGGFVAACGRDLKWVNVPVRYASRPRQSTPQAAVRVAFFGTELVVPRTHIFLTLQYRLIPAYQLNTKLLLLGADGNGVAIEAIEKLETKSVFQFVATSEGAPPDDLRYHLLNSQGIVSGDYAVQRAYEKRELPPSRLAFSYPSGNDDAFPEVVATGASERGEGRT